MRRELELDEDELDERELDDELDDELREELDDELLEEGLLLDELDEGDGDDDEALGEDELEEGVGPVVESPHPPSIPTPASTAPPERIFRNSRRSSSRFGSTTATVGFFGDMNGKTSSTPQASHVPRRHCRKACASGLQRRQRAAFVVALDRADDVLRRDHVHAARQVAHDVDAKLLILGVAVAQG